MTSAIQENETSWTLVIRSQRRLFDLRLKELSGISFAGSTANHGKASLGFGTVGTLLPVYKRNGLCAPAVRVAPGEGK